MANVLVYAYGFTGLVVYEVDLRQADKHGVAVSELELRLDAAAYDLLWWDSVSLGLSSVQESLCASCGL